MSKKKIRSIQQLESELRALAIVYPNIVKLSPLIEKACYNVSTFYYYYGSSKPMIDIINEARREAGIKALITTVPQTRKKTKTKSHPVVTKTKPVTTMRHYPVKYFPVSTVLRWTRRRINWTQIGNSES